MVIARGQTSSPASNIARCSSCLDMVGFEHLEPDSEVLTSMNKSRVAMKGRQTIIVISMISQIPSRPGGETSHHQGLI